MLLPWTGEEKQIEEVAFVSGLERQVGCGSAEGGRSTSLMTCVMESRGLKPGNGASVKC